MKRSLTVLLTIVISLFTIPISTAFAEEGEGYELENGDYEVYIKTLEANSDKESIAGGFMSDTAILSVQGDDSRLTLGVVKPGEGDGGFGSFDFSIEWVKVAGKEHIDEEDGDEFTYYTFSLESIEEVLNAKMEYVVPGFPGLGDGHEVDFRIKLGDTSKLKKIVDKAEEEVQYHYTEKSWSTFEAELKSAKELLNEDKIHLKKEIDQFHDALKNAMEKLEIDTSNLEEAIEKAQSKNESNYTADSWLNLQEALNKAESIFKKENVKFQEVDKAFNSLIDAIEQLKVEKSELEEAINLAEKESEIGYTSESWKKFSSALEKAKDVFNNENATKEEVDNATNELNTAQTNLTVDKSELNELIKQAEDKIKSNYTSETWQGLSISKEEAIKVNNDENATVEDVKTAIKDLERAINNLEGVKADLEFSLNEAETLNEEIFTTDSWNEFQEVYLSALKVYEDPEVSEEEINEITEKLKLAINSLVVDKSELEEQIYKVKELNKDDYTQKSWEKVSSALAIAEKIMKDENASVEDVEKAVEKLLKAINNLEKSIDEQEEVQNGKGELEDLIETSNEKNRSNYTEDSWKSFKDELEKAKKVLAKEDATEKEIAKAKENLEEAIEGLKKKSDTDYTVQGKVENPQMGVKTPMALYVMLLFGSVLIIGFYVYRLRYSKREN